MIRSNFSLTDCLKASNLFVHEQESLVRASSLDWRSFGSAIFGKARLLLTPSAKAMA
jgi:hypothetical protein